MTLEQLAASLEQAGDNPVHICLPDGDFIPSHYHLTEVGRVHKDFIDCGGVKREAKSALLQIWVATDTEHRLTASKFAMILRMADKSFTIGDYAVEIEYEREHIGQFPLSHVEFTPRGPLLNLVAKHTDCLAKEACGVAGCC
jgi:hypothetical protein